MHSNSFPFVLAPLRRSLCLFWCETHTKGLRTRSHARPEVEWEGRSERRQRRQLTTEGRREQSAWDSSPERDTVGWRRQWEDGGRAEKRSNRSQKDDCKDLLTYRGQVNQCENMSALLVACENFVRVLVHVSSQNALCHIYFPLLALGADPSPCLFVCFFSSTLSVVFYVAVKKCVMPLVGSKRNHWMNHWP